MKDIILNILEASIAVKDRCIRDHMDLIIKGADLLTTCLTTGHKVLIFGNGGSAADAQHIAAEFVNRFQIERHPLAASPMIITLTKYLPSRYRPWVKRTMWPSGSAPAETQKM